jgi:nucleotide-binding universal stress UspA family protein
MISSSILVPLDGSPLAEAALPYAVALATATGDSLCLFAVAEQQDAGRFTSERALAEEVLRERKERLTLYLAEVAAREALAALRVEQQVVTGEAVAQILAAANADSVSMTVLATRGRSGLQRLLLGSVADKVMRLNSRPTLVVRPSESETGVAPLRLARIMTPLDGSPRAEAALEPAARYARALGAMLLLVRAVQPLEALVGSERNTDDFADADKQQDRAALAYLTDVRAQLGDQINVDLLLVETSPLQLPEYATTIGVDLVVMTTRGHGGLKRLALGSVADRMARLGPPVLLVPQREPVTSAEPSEQRSAAPPGPRP